MSSALLESVHDPDTGLLDAGQIKTVSRFSLRQIAQFIGINYETLKGNTCAPSAQPGLAKFVHSWELLQTIFPEDQSIRNWLRHPIRRFHGKTPEWLLSAKGIDSFVAYVEELVEGGRG